MNDQLHAGMLEATRLTRAGRIGEATALLQRIVRTGRNSTAPQVPQHDPTAPSGDVANVIDLMPDTVEETDPQPPPAASSGDPMDIAEAQPPKALCILGGLERIGSLLGAGVLTKPTSVPTAEVVPIGGRFITSSYGNHAGSRIYKLYIPSAYQGQAVPLVVMMHGCTQSPDDFAAGTRMNVLGEESTCLIAYPAQAASANASKCWNWFSPSHQQRGQGEPSLIAGITRQIMRDYAADPRRIYIAGLSAGGAAASIMAKTYPELYAAVGVHSGLAPGAASDLASAHAVMQQGYAPAGNLSAGIGVGEGRMVPTIVFHGDQDARVHPRNGDHVMGQVGAAASMGLRKKLQRGRMPNGHAYTKTLYVDPSGCTVFEQWIIHGLGHAWSGGTPAGSYTDPRGPDAAREMLRFFLQHVQPAPERSR